MKENKNKIDSAESGAPQNIQTEPLSNPQSHIPDKQFQPDILKRKVSKIVIFGIIIVPLALIVVLTAIFLMKDNDKSTSADEVFGTEATSEFAEYKDDELGLKFFYPARWGTPVKKTNDPKYPDRQVVATGYTEYDITFPNAPLFILPLINMKNNYLVQYAGCFNSAPFLDIFRDQQPELFKVGEWAQSETSPGNDYTTYTKILADEKDMVIAEQFAVNTQANRTACNGLSVYGTRDVQDNPKALQKAQFVWSETLTKGLGKDQPDLGLDTLEDFKNNPSKYISEQDLKDLQTVIKSIQSY